MKSAAESWLQYLPAALCSNRSSRSCKVRSSDEACARASASSVSKR
jgi:hypothetical protein